MILPVNGFKFINRNTGVKLRGLQGLMTQQLLNVAHRRPAFHHLRCAGVSEGVRADILFNTGTDGMTIDHRPDPVGIHLSFAEQPLYAASEGRIMGISPLAIQKSLWFNSIIAL